MLTDHLWKLFLSLLMNLQNLSDSLPSSKASPTVKQSLLYHQCFCKFQQISMHLFSKMKIKDSTGITLKLQYTPFVIYYIDSGITNHIISFVMISDCLHHDTITVYLFQKNLIFLKKQCSTPDKIIYFSKGAASQ